MFATCKFWQSQVEIFWVSLWINRSILSIEVHTCISRTLARTLLCTMHRVKHKVYCIFHLYYCPVSPPTPDTDQTPSTHYENMPIKIYRKFHLQKLKIFRLKNWYFSNFCSKHRLWYSLEPPRRGGSNEYPQSMVLSRNKKNNIYPYKPQFYYIKVGFKGVKII